MSDEAIRLRDSDKTAQFGGPAPSLKVRVLKELAAEMFEDVSGYVSESNSPGAVNADEGLNFYAEVRRFEIKLIKVALRYTAGHQLRAARLLGMNATTLNGKLKQFNIQAK